MCNIRENNGNKREIRSILHVCFLFGSLTTSQHLKKTSQNLNNPLTPIGSGIYIFPPNSRSTAPLRRLSADPALAGYRRVRYCLPSMSSLHVFLPVSLLCCLPSISSLHVFLPLSLLSSGDLGRVREGGWAAEKRWGTPSPPTPPQPSLCQSFPRSCGLWWSAWIPKKSIVEISGSNLMPK